MQAQQTFQLEAIPFIQLEAKGFSLHPAAKQFLDTLTHQEFGVLSVVGRYRTGKSFLLNKLLKHKKAEGAGPVFSGFKVGPTINPCTKGLWLLKHVFYFLRDSGQISYTPVEGGVPVLVVDTEGLGGFDEEENHDTKIFLLGMLLSSLMVYNSLGPIDEGALNNISLIINLSKSMRIQSKDADMNEEEFASYFPSLVWVLRDFMLRMEDREGNPITPKQYLENSLSDQRGSSDNIQNKNRIRRLLRQFFQDRDCCLLVRPVEQEGLLQRLDDLPNSKLRPEFIEQLNGLRRKLVRKVKVKRQSQRALNGPMLVELAQTYMAALNSEDVPVIESAWTNVCRMECERVKTELVEDFERTLAKSVAPKMPLSKQAFAEVVARLVGERRKAFAGRSLGDEQERYEKVLVEMLEKEAGRMERKNEELLAERFEKEMERGFAEVEQGVRFRTIRNMAEYRDKVEAFQQKFKSAEPEFQAKLSQFLTDKVLAHGEAISRESEAAQQQEVKLVKARLGAAEEELGKKRKELAHRQESYGESVNTLETVKIQLEARVGLLEGQIGQLREEKERAVDVARGQLEVKLRGVEDGLEEIKRDAEMWRGRATKAEQERAEAQTELERVKAVMTQQEQLVGEQVEQWKARVAEHKADQKEVKLQLDQARSQIEETRALLESTERELESALTREKQNEEEEWRNRTLAAEKDFTEKQNVFLKEQLQENQKLYSELVAALRLDSSSSPRKPHSTGVEESDLLLQANKALMRAISQADRQRGEVEARVQKFKKYQRMVRCASSLTCKGCRQSFPPALFPAHLKLCAETVAISTEQAEPDEVRLRLNRVEEKGELTQLHLEVSYGQSKWQLRREVSALESLAQQVCQAHPHVRLSGIETPSAEAVRRVLQELECLYVLKQFRPFRDFLGLEEQLEAAASPPSRKRRLGSCAGGAAGGACGGV